MSVQISLRINQGAPGETELTFTERARVVVGRAKDCDLLIPPDFLHADVSRHHCAFNIDPPRVRVSDLGSRNGTYVNGVRINQQGDIVFYDDGTAAGNSEVRLLQDGDEVRLGGTRIQIGIRGRGEESTEEERCT